MMLSACRIIK